MDTPANTIDWTLDGVNVADGSDPDCPADDKGLPAECWSVCGAGRLKRETDVTGHRDITARFNIDASFVNHLYIIFVHHIQYNYTK